MSVKEFNTKVYGRKVQGAVLCPEERNLGWQWSAVSTWDVILLPKEVNSSKNVDNSLLC